MKLKSVILILLLFGHTTMHCMQPEDVSHAQQNNAQEDTLGWYKYVPFVSQADTGAKNIQKVGDGITEVGKGIAKVGDGFNKVADSVTTTSKEVATVINNASNTVDKGINTLSSNIKEASADFIKATDKVSLEMDGIQKNGVKVSPETIAEINKTGVSLMKTYLTASVGAAITLAGLFLLYKTITSETDEEKPNDTRPLYKKILANRYLISGLLMASGIGIILKSDRIVAAVA